MLLQLVSSTGSSESGQPVAKKPTLSVPRKENLHPDKVDG
jgi:hypothetical protein